MDGLDMDGLATDGRDSAAAASPGTAMVSDPSAPALPRFTITDKVAVIARPQSIEVEAVASLRNYLLGKHLRDGRRSLAVCGATRDVGASYLSVNLAFAMAQAGVNTILIDGNLREPALDQYVTPDVPQEGLSDYLDGDAHRAFAVVQSDIVPNLSLLYAGTPTSQAQEMVASHRFQDLLDNCVRSYDLTIVDCPPANTSGDARRIAALMRYALVVARKNRSYLGDVRKLVGELQTDRATIVGTFLNVIS